MPTVHTHYAHAICLLVVRNVVSCKRENTIFPEKSVWYRPSDLWNNHNFALSSFHISLFDTHTQHRIPNTVYAQNIHTITLHSNRTWQKVINFSSRSTFNVYRTLHFSFESISTAPRWASHSCSVCLKKIATTAKRQRTQKLIVTTPIVQISHLYFLWMQLRSCSWSLILIMKIRWHGISPIK